MRPESGARETSLEFVPLILEPRPNIGCHFQGTFSNPANPGLKPWAMISDHFMVKPGSSTFSCVKPGISDTCDPFPICVIRLRFGTTGLCNFTSENFGAADIKIRLWD